MVIFWIDGSGQQPVLVSVLVAYQSMGSVPLLIGREHPDIDAGS